MAFRTGVNLDGLADFSGRHQVAELALFGSCLREDFGSESDIDILVTFKPEAKVSLTGGHGRRTLTALRSSRRLGSPSGTEVLYSPLRP